MDKGGSPDFTKYFACACKTVQKHAIQRRLGGGLLMLADPPAFANSPGERVG